MEPRDIWARYNSAVARANPSVVTDNRKLFKTAPDLSQPINVYIHRQEKCQERAKCWDSEIKDEKMERFMHEKWDSLGS